MRARLAHLLALVLVLGLGPLPPVHAGPAPDLPARVVSATDRAEFRRFTLDNGLRVLLVSDPAFNKSAASLAVHVGQIDDPRDTEGMAHFLEHMLFLGTAKYPDEGEYRRYIRANGGSNNAYTASDHTNYFFEVRHEALAGALDRFAQFFIAPRLDPAFVGREVNAVHNEAMRHVQNDARRLAAVRRELYDPASGESKFSTGNRDTLARATPEAVREFYLRHYSADRMALAIAGKASLDELERHARALFAVVPRREVATSSGQARFLPRKPALRMAFVEPVKEVRELLLEFPVGPTRPHFASHPDRLLAELLRYAGPGGLLQRLRGEGLANDLGVSLWERTGGYGSLFVSVDLTPEGQARHARVMEQVFACLDQLRRTPFPHDLYRDLARVGTLQETHGDRGEGSALARQLARQALFYPLEVAERAASAWGKPDEAAYRQLLDALTPDNMLASLMAKGVSTERRDRIYGVAYTYREDDGAAYQALLRPRADLRVALPVANRYVPQATSLLAERALPLIDEPGLRLHYAPDTEFQRPQTSWVMRFVPPRELGNAESEALLALWGRCLRDSLEAVVSEAQAAGVSVGTEFSLEGVKLSLTGYGDSAGRVARVLAAQLRSFTVTPERFAALQELALRRLQSYPQTEAYVLARDRRDAMVREFEFLPEQLLPHTHRAGWDDVRDFGSRLLQRGQLEVLVHGHTAPDEAVATTRAIAAAIGAEAAPPGQLVRRRHVRIDPGENLVDGGRIAGVNSAYIGDFLLPGDTPQVRAASLVLGAFISPRFFTELRSRQQLGYIVGASPSASLRERYLTFVIQSSDYASGELRRRAEAYAATLPAALAALSDADWLTLKDGVRSTLEGKPKSIGERAERLFASAYLYDGEWSRRQDELQALDALGRDEAVRLLADALAPQSARRRTVLLDAEPRGGDGSVVAGFSDREAWKRTREFH